MLGNTLLLMGSEEQREYYLPRVLSGEDTWCQGYSEPNAGSDLGNVGLKAQLDGDQWVLNGQKIWTSAGHLADHIFTLARTDPEAPKHKGISFLLVDMRQPGVEVRPIKMINGDSEFNEVFYTDALCPKDNVVGGVNNGWAVAMTLLGFERGEAAATMPIRFQAEIDRLVVLAAERGLTKDPVIRQELMKAYAKVQIMRYSGMRVLTQFLKGITRVQMAPYPSCTGANTISRSPNSQQRFLVQMRWSLLAVLRHLRLEQMMLGRQTPRHRGATLSCRPEPARSTLDHHRCNET